VLLSKVTPAHEKFNALDILFLYACQLLLLFAVFEHLQALESVYKIPTLIRLALPSDTPHAAFSGPGALNEWRKERKKFITIYLTGDVEEDKKRFEVVQYEARKLKYTCDTNAIIKVHFNSNNTYGQFFGLITVMLEDHHKRYMCYQDDFYILADDCDDSMTK